MTKIATDITTTLLAIYAGQTITHDAILTEITNQYAYANKRPGITSYFKITDALERSGATYHYTGPNHTGTCYYTFPAAA